MIHAEEVFVVFYKGTPLERIALHGVSFSVQQGEIISVVGNNGCGRSALLSFLAGHISSSFGKLWLDKMDITSQTLFDRSMIFSSVFYDLNLGSAGNLTVAENLALAGMHHQPHSIIKPALTKEANDMFFEQLKNLDFMNMELLLTEKVNLISKAHRHVLAMLMAVIKGAKVLLIDEHSTGLDQKTAAMLLEATEKIIKSSGMTTIMAVNDPKFSLDVADRTFVLSHGQIVSRLDKEAKKKMKPEDLVALFNLAPPPDAAEARR
ncbi:MAG: ATP-binding cassette domain-containing protein [Holosporaceae bacterium]|jgi:putative ABC transport system ATP-binding protein|nr:ATP-binding cassette domain-containing protein [Holosporaceae bacterium]